jgi:alkanesulfonate monooxygenase SsuD/methylene tetrahydromethanopterin reductase-like flavin-dependent oxidoreductase (luciferase family)
MNDRAQIRIGLSLTPEANAADALIEHVTLADGAGLDLVGIQDHPYQRRFLDTLALIGVLLGKTRRISIFPDVANLPLRPPAVLAKAAASLDVLSGGRFELGLGAGYFWDAVAAMGGPKRSPGEAVDALAEAIEIIRAFWRPDRSVTHDGRHYTVLAAHPGPHPAHPIEIWLGAYKPRMLRLVGQAADGWIPSLGRASAGELRDGNARIDEAATAAGREPAAIRRLLNLGGTITAPGPSDATPDDAGEGRDGPAGPPSFWQEELERLHAIGFTAFVFWPRGDDIPAQIDRLAREVAPALRDTT